MKPILYNPDETSFSTNGIGVLSGAVSCKVLQELNGRYELTMQYPVIGLHFGQIAMRSVILAKVDPVSELQPFRVYRITKPSNGIVTVYARHIAYDLKGVAVSPFTAKSIAAAFSGIHENAVTDCPFTFTTDKDTATSFSVKVPKEVWTILGGSEGSILDVFGGEYEFDRWKVALWNKRGADRGVSIRYGKNLTSLEQDENCANCYTGVMPYWVDPSTGAVVTLSGKIVAAKGNFGYTKIYPLDLSYEFETAPSESELEAAAAAYITKSKICEPVIGWKVEYVSLEQTEEYKGMALLERVLLGDTVEVVFEKLGIEVKARAVSGLYDSILERYDYIDLGSVRANMADVIVQQGQEIKKKPSVSLLQSITMTLTSKILGAKGGAVRLLDDDGDGQPDTLYVADNADPAAAVKVWRWNYEGWAGSKNGYNGPFTLGATLEDGILAEAITAAHLVAGTIMSQDGKTFFLDLDNGILKGAFTELTITGKTVEEIAKGEADRVKKSVNADLVNFSQSVTGSINSLQSQIDGNITTWFDNYVPTAENEPACSWTTDAQKKQHLGDLFYIVDNDQTGGQCYRWTVTNGTYGWLLVEDTEVAKALADAAKAKDIADGKRRVFVAQPVPPYDMGDLWAQGDSGDLMVCKVPRATGSFAASDWELATDYINAETAGSIAQGKVDAQTQLDIFNKLTDNGKMEGLFMQDGQLYINASYIKSGSIVSEGTAYLPPTYDDVMHMLWSISFPDRFPPEAFFDLNGDGRIDRDDVVLAKEAYLGKRDISTCPGAYKTAVTVTIEPSNTQAAVRISGVNMWGSEVTLYLGTNGSSIPLITGDCSVGGKFAVGDYAILQSLSTDVEQEPKKLSWKKINGVNALIGYEDEEPEVQSMATLYSGALDSGAVSFAGAYSQYVIVGYTTQSQCKVSMTIPAPSCDGSLFQLYADGEWVSFTMAEDALTISRVSSGGAITGIYGII